MSAKNKLDRFAELKTFDHVLEPGLDEVLVERKTGKMKPHWMKGKWRSDFFKNDNPIVLELGCGRGEYSVGMGRHFPQKNFLGVDIKGARIWKGLLNVGFLRTRIDFIHCFFEPEEIDEIWITFPDPQPQKNRARKRLTHPLFINRYRQFLKPGGIIHLKTDNTFFFEYTLDEIEEQGYDKLIATADLYGDTIANFDDDTREILHIRTFYENLFAAQGSLIKYCKFRLPN